MKRISAMPLMPLMGTSGTRSAYPFPLGREAVTLWFNARAAIWQGVGQIGLREGDRVLVPAYSCGAEVDALLKAGLKLDWYRVTEDLVPDIGHIEELLRTPASALYVTHYFGFPQPMGEIGAFAREHGLLLIEDAAQSLYSDDETGMPLGSFGDMAVFSLTKTLPLPDGGALRLKTGGPRNAVPPRAKRPAFFPVAGRLKYLAEEALIQKSPHLVEGFRRNVSTPVASWIKGKVSGNGEATAGAGMDDVDMRRMLLDDERTSWGMSGVSRLLLGRVCRDDVREKRRRNFEAILSRFEKGRKVAPLFDALPKGCCPLFFPVRTGEARALCRFLAARNVFYFRIWALFHKAMPMDRFPFESMLKRDVVALPIHQDLGENEMARIADLLNLWNRGEE